MMDPQEAFATFVDNSGYAGVPGMALAFFVGYAYGATGARENIDALVKAFNATQKTEDVKGGQP
jgi:hypothetical protein